MKLVYVGGQVAGLVGLLAVAAKWPGAIQNVVACDRLIEDAAEGLGIPWVWNVFDEVVEGTDLLVCVHGREILSSNILALPAHGGLNLHPCLSEFPGKDPIGRFLAAHRTRASVGAHQMTAQVDRGLVLVEHFLTILKATRREEVYQQLYPVYAEVLWRAIPLALTLPPPLGGGAALPTSLRV